MYFEPDTVYTTNDQLASNTMYRDLGCNSVVQNPSVVEPVCGECRKNYYPLSISYCNPCSLQGCDSCTSSACLTGCSDGLFLDTGVCNFCYLTCKSCASYSPDACLSCKDGFYFKQNSFDSRGQCLPCHTKCKTCFGPSDIQCGELKNGYFWVDFGLDSVSSQACSAACGKCEEESARCTECFSLGTYSTLDEYVKDTTLHTCTLTSNANTFLKCADLAVFPDSSVQCDRCLPGHYYSKLTNTCMSTVAISQCLITQPSADGRDVYCSACFANYAYNQDTKTCIPSTLGSYCDVHVAFGLKLYCAKCKATRTLDPITGLCVSSCSVGPNGRTRLALTLAGVKHCYEMPPGCLSGVFDAGGEFFCNTCDAPTFVKYDPADRYCLNLICNNAFTGINKQCTPANNPGLCDPNLCLWTNLPLQCNAGACIYDIFQLEFSGTDLTVKLKSDIGFLFSFDVKDFVVYEAISAAEKRVFCSMISPDINDNLSTCTYLGDQIKLSLVQITFEKLVAAGKLNLNKKAFKVFRRMLSLDNIDITDPANSLGFNFNSQALLNTASKRTGSWFAVFEKNMNYDQGIRAAVHSKNTNLQISSYFWECTSAGADAALKQELNLLLAGFKDKPLSVQLNNINFKSKQVKIKLSVTDQFSQIHESYFTFTVTSSLSVFELFEQTPVYYVDGETGVFVSLRANYQNININDVTYTAEGLVGGGSFTTNLQKRANHYVLHLKVTGGNDFNLQLGYLTYPTGQLQLVRVKPNYISEVIHPTAVDNINPFKFQLISRKSTFQLYCVDESSMSQCVPNPQNQVFSVGDEITLADIFNFGTESAKKIFFRIGSGYYDTVSSIEVLGKTSSQQTAPLIDIKPTIDYPESPFLSKNVGLFLDSRLLVVQSATGEPTTYINTQGLEASYTPTFDVASSLRQFFLTNQPDSLVRRLQFLLQIDGGLGYHLVSQSNVPTPQTLSVKIRKSATSDNLVLLEVTSSTDSRGLCNDPDSTFTFHTVLNQRFHLADYGHYSGRNLIPRVFDQTPLQLKVHLHTYCSILSSTEEAILDDSGLDYVSSLSSYIGFLTLKTASNSRDQMNSYNLIMAHLNQMYSRCSASQYCPVGLAEIRTEAAKILSKLIEFYEDSRFAMLVRYSLVGSFVWENYLVNAEGLKKLLEVTELTSAYIVSKLLPALQSHTRFQRGLRLAVSQQDMLLADQVDFPVDVTSSLLANVLFSYLPDADRNQQIDRAFKTIIRHYEKKMLKVSSHLKQESFENTHAKVAGLTITSPLRSEYSVSLDPDTQVVLRNLQFSQADPYYEVIIVSWQQALITRLKQTYEDGLNEFLSQDFYIDFVNYFAAKIPIGGQANLYRKPANCAAPTTANCLDQTPVPGLVLCKCYDLATISSRSPTLGTRTLPAPQDPPIGLGPTSNPAPPPSNPSGPQIPTPPTEPAAPGTGSSSGGLIHLPSADPIIPNNPSFHTFAVTAGILELVILVCYLGFLLKKSALNRIARKYFEKCCTQVLVHDIMQQVEKHDDLDRMFSLEPEESSSDGSSSPSDCTIKESELQDKEKRVLRRLKHLKNKHPELDLSSLRKDDLARLTLTRFFFMYLKLNHAWASLAFLRSSKYFRITMITLTYSRILAHLAVSMFFTLSSLP